MTPRTIARVLAFVTAACVFQPAGFGQARGGVAGTPSTGGTTSPTTTGPGSMTTTTPNMTTTPSNPNQTTTPQPQVPQPIFISGRVMMEDGTAPSESVIIERVCGGSPHAEGYTDSKGYFALELGKPNDGVIQDASEENSRRFGGYPGGASGSGMSASGSGSGTGRMNNGPGSELRLANCELRARLGGYRSQAVSLAGRRAMDNPDIGLILLHRLGPNEGSMVSTNSLSAPKDAKKAFDKGEESLKKKKIDDAAKSFQKAVDLYPEYAAAWQELGRLQMANGDALGARGAFENAARADSKFAAPLVDLAVLDMEAQKWRDVVVVTDRAAIIDAFDYPQIFLFNAVANYNLHNFDAAEKSARQAQKLDTRHELPKASHLLGLILAMHKDYPAAAEQLREYLKFAPNATDAAAVRSQLDQIEKLGAPSASIPQQDQ